MKTDFLEEPELEFGAGSHIDIRYGLSTFGPLDRGTATAPREIRVGLVGTAETLEGIQDWLAACRVGVAAKATHKVNLFPSFPGFSHDSCFDSCLSFHERWTARISDGELSDLVSNTRPDELPRESADTFVRHAERVLELGKVDVIICAPPTELLAALDSRAPRAPDDTESGLDESTESEEGDAWRPAFHDVLKACGMRLAVPLQMVRPPTYEGGKSTRASAGPLQDPATRAWNFHTALYYKAGGIPWRLQREATALSTCYIGISFYRSADGDRLLTSVAQVFNERGEGVIVRGAPAQVDKSDRTPHLSTDDAHSLMSNAIVTYRREHRTTPARVVVHKTSGLNEHEVRGFTQAAKDHRVEVTDLASVRRSFTRLFRMGTYPPLRGTLLHLTRRTGLLYLRGSVSFFEAYPGLYVPRPIEFELAHTEATVTQVATELLGLSKLNWNNTQFDGGEPITVRAARRVGDILKCIPTEGGLVQPSFRFYM
jgi:hypothetical protein